MIPLVAFLVAITSSDGAIYDAVVRSVYADLHHIPAVRLFVADSTLRVTATSLRKITPDRDDTGELAIYDRIRKHAAFDAMLARSGVKRSIPRLKETTLFSTEPQRLRCEGTNWELSRDVVLHFGTPGYSRDGNEAVVFVTVRDCISSANLVVLLQRTNSRWEIESEACLACRGE